MITLYPELYNDVFGPVMQPGSSSHTAAPCRLGFMAQSLLDEPVARVRVLLDRKGSFAGTFGIMSEDSGMIAGALGMLQDDPRLFEARSIARDQGVQVDFVFDDLIESDHPNAMKFALTGASGRTVELVGNSTGGGMIETVSVNGFPVAVHGDSYVLLIFDPGCHLDPSHVRAFARDLPGFVDSWKVAQAPSGVLHVARSSERIDVSAARAAFPNHEVLSMHPVLPVLLTPKVQPQLFDTMTEWRAYALEHGIPLWEAVVDYEIAASGWTRKRILEQMEWLANKMRRQTHAVYEELVSVPTSPYKPDIAAEWARHMESPRRLTDPLTANTLKWAHGAGAGIPGVEVVAGPMGGGGGYVYAALCAVQDAHGFSDEDLLHGLFVAGGVGILAFSRTEPTGERIGCTGEVGICGAMAAAGIVEMVGGTPAQAEHAASLLLQFTLGMPCDPIPGGYCQPCRSRVLSATTLAHVFADMALAGRDALLPLHEAIDVADAIGRQLPPELLCTSTGGAAAAPSAQRRAIEFREWFIRSEEEGFARPPGNLI